jgi:hypothetical protein
MKTLVAGHLLLKVSLHVQQKCAILKLNANLNLNFQARIIQILFR